MASNAARPKKLPGRRWGPAPGLLYRQVHYQLGELAQLGFMARWRHQGRVPLELSAKLAPARRAFDHAEYWLCYPDDQRARDLDRRILVGHPYRFDPEAEAALRAAAEMFDLVWWTVPPKSPVPGMGPGTGTTSWYSDHAWMIVVQPAKFLVGHPAPEECKVRYGRSARRALSEGETYETSGRVPPPEQTPARARRPEISPADVLENPRQSMQRAKNWSMLAAKKKRIEELEAARAVERELAEADRRIAELERGE